MRKCSVCGKAMASGWVIHDGLSYACSLTCLHSLVTPERYSELYENGEAYYTEWDDEEEEEEVVIDLYEEPNNNVSCTLLFFKEKLNPVRSADKYDINVQDRIRDTPKNIIRYLNMRCEQDGFVGYKIIIKNSNEFADLYFREREFSNDAVTSSFVIKTIRDHDECEMYVANTYSSLLRVLNNAPYPMIIRELKGV